MATAFGRRMARKAALGRALRALEGDPPGLLTEQRLKALFVAGEIEVGELERGLAIVLARERARDLAVRE